MSKARDLADFISSGAITATADEINTLDGITATTAELNYTDGVTAAIQTQIDNKGIITGTASDALTPGDVCALNSDGTISVGSQRLVPANVPDNLSPLSNTSQEISGTAGYYYYNLVYHPVQDRVVIFYGANEAGGTRTGYCVAGEVDAAAQTITFGTEVKFTPSTSNNAYSIDAMYEPTADRIVLAYATDDDTTDVHYLYISVVSLSGSTITVNTPTQVWTENSNNSLPYVYPNRSLAFNSTQNTCLIAFAEGSYSTLYGGDPDVRVMPFTVGSTSITTGSSVRVQTDSSEGAIAYSPDRDVYLCAYRDGNTSASRVRVIIPGGTTAAPSITLHGSAIATLDSTDSSSVGGNILHHHGIIWDSTLGSFLVTGDGSSSNLNSWMQKILVNSITNDPSRYPNNTNGFTILNDYSATGDRSYPANFYYDPDESNYKFFYYTRNLGQLIKYRTISAGGVDTISDAYDLNETGLTVGGSVTSSYYLGNVVYDTASNRPIVGLLDPNGGSITFDPLVGVFGVDAQVNPLTKESFIGFAQNTAAIGETVTVHSDGFTDANQTGLTAGQSYYASATDGSLGTTPGNDAVFVGTALSATEIRVASDDNATKFFTTNAGVVSVDGTDAGFNILGNATAAAEFEARSYNETYAAVTSTSNATTVDCETGNSFSHTLTENTTFTFSNPPASGTAYSFSIEIIQDASASGFTVTWPASVDWPSATAPTLTATASAKDVFVFTTRDGGTTWYGFTAGQALG